MELFAFALDFPDLNRANEYTLYNSCLFKLLHLLISTVSPSSSSLSVSSRGGASSSLFELGSEREDQRREAALEVCRAVPYHLVFEKHGCGGAFLLMQRLTIVLLLFGRESEEGRWVEGVLEMIGER